MKLGSHVSIINTILRVTITRGDRALCWFNTVKVTITTGYISVRENLVAATLLVNYQQWNKTKSNAGDLVLHRDYLIPFRFLWFNRICHSCIISLSSNKAGIVNKNRKYLNSVVGVVVFVTDIIVIMLSF